MGRSHTFRFYDVELGLSGDCDAVLAALRRSYGLFSAAPIEPIEQTVQRIQVNLTDGGNDGFSISVTGSGAVWRLPPLQPDEIANLLVRHALAQVCSHLLLHAGALIWQEQAILLAGDSGAGKTTLTLALEQRGFAFLSDETGAIGRAGESTGIVQPFPRPPHVRPGPGDQLGQKGSAGWMPTLGKSSPLGHLFILGSELATNPVAREYIVLCDRLDSTLLPRLECMFGLVGVSATICQGLPAFSYSSSSPARPFSTIEEFCLTQGTIVLDVVEQVPACTFARRPRLERVQASRAAVQALGHLQNGYRSRLFHTIYGGNPVAFYAGLAGLLGHVACYRLQPGPLDETVDLVCAVVK